MKNWQTTIPAILAAAAGFVMFSPAHFPPVAVDLSRYIFAGGLAVFGIAAKDASTHSTPAQVFEAQKKEEAKGANA